MAARPAGRPGWVLALLGGLLLLAIGLSLSVGAFTIPFREVFDVVGARLGVLGADLEFRTSSIVWDIRLPRSLMAVTVGSGLAVAGAALQGVFRARMADPHLLGVGPGASLGAALGAGAGVSAAVAGGTVGGLLAGLLLRGFGRRKAAQQSRLILTGLALGASLSALVGLVVFSGDRTQVPPVEFWLLGSLAGSTWAILGTVVVLSIIAAVVVIVLARVLDLMALGEAEASHLGVDVPMVTLVLLLAVGALVGAGVGAVGVVGFVGLVAPHIARRLVGPGHRTLIPVAALVGALFVVLADVLARTLVSPIEIPIGVVTAVVGGPFFLWLTRGSDL